MSGHTPIRLLLTCPPLPASDAIRVLLDTLRRDFRADLRIGQKNASGQLLHAWGTLVIGESEISFEAELLSDMSGAGVLCPTILLHSEAYEAAFDLFRGRVRPRGKRALVEFCLSVAASTQAEGFSLGFAGDEEVKPLTTENLVRQLTSDQPNSLVAGLTTSSPLLGKLKETWSLGAERNGYLTLEFI